VATEDAQYIATVDGRAAVPVIAAGALLVAARIALTLALALTLGVRRLTLAVPLTLALAFAITRVGEHRARGQGHRQ